MSNLNSKDIEKMIENAWINLLKHVYMSVNWKSFSRRHRYGDIFEHRVKVSCYERDVPRFLERLCNRLNLQAPNLPIEEIELLRKYNDLSMSYIRKYTRLIVIYAIDKAIKEWKERKNKVGGE